MESLPFSSARIYARTGGILYFVLILVGMFAELFVRGTLIVSGDAAATAHNLIAHQQLWQAGIVADLLMHLLDIPIMLVVFVLLSPVSKNIALFALLFNIVQTAVLVANKLNLIAALLPLQTAAYLKDVALPSLYSQTYLSIRLHDIGFGVGLLFFGCTCLINGYLVRKSGYFPRTIGFLLQIAGICYLTSSFVLLLEPGFHNPVFPAIMLPCFVAELSFCFWLIFKGVDAVKWQQMAAV